MGRTRQVVFSEKVKGFNGWKEEEDFAAFEIQIDFPFLDTLDTLDTFGGCRLSLKKFHFYNSSTL